MPERNGLDLLRLEERIIRAQTVYVLHADAEGFLKINQQLATLQALGGYQRHINPVDIPSANGCLPFDIIETWENEGVLEKFQSYRSGEAQELYRELDAIIERGHIQ